jgi:hypothetical protein
LALQIREYLEKKEQNELPIYIVPSEYTASWKPGYIKRVKSYFKNEDKVQILSESKLNSFLHSKVEE